VDHSDRDYKNIFFVLLLLQGCYSYKPLVIKSRVSVKDFVPSEKNSRKFFIKKNKKYFAYIRSSSPIAKINNRGVELALKGKFLDAESLFKESIQEDGEQPAVYNNLGIIYEIFKLREKAFNMYSKACIKEPENVNFRNNFLSFVNPHMGNRR
jgi:tetratricopeptide (TPR) repeat protein